MFPKSDPPVELIDKQIIPSPVEQLRKLPAYLLPDDFDWGELDNYNQVVIYTFKTRAGNIAQEVHSLTDYT